VSYLGHIISPQGVAMDPEKIEYVMGWPAPTTLKELRGFLGLTGYYRKFVQGYGTIAKPLTELLKKNAFGWSSQAERSFLTLKQAMTQAPVLALPDFSKPFVMECDASGLGIGAVLLQDNQPIAYFSKAIKGTELGLSTYEKEMLALVLAVQRWRPYLLGSKFIVRTDQKSLKFLLDQTISTTAQQRWLVKLLGYDYDIKYKRGKENSVADALSQVEESKTLMAISHPVPHWLEPIQEEIQSNPELQALVIRIQAGEAVGPWKFREGLIFFKERVYLPSTSPFIPPILAEIHGSTHEGFFKTMNQLKTLFYWPKMKERVKTFIRECEVCQRHKVETTMPSGLLQPLPVPTKVWAEISMDFIDGLPKSHGKSTILVVVDRLSKYGHFISISHPYTAP
jgi:hypothetical protein